MPKYSLIGSENPFLHVTLTKGETILCESNAMVMFEEGLEYLGTPKAGITDVLKRKISNAESFLQQKIQAVRADGDCLFASYHPGGIEFLDVGDIQYYLASKSFIACDETVQLNTKVQGTGKMLFGGSGEYMFGQTSGRGKLAVGGYGSMFLMDVRADKEITLDLGHVVAWDSSLQFQLSNQSSTTSMLDNVVNAVKSGEGTILKLRGNGKVLLCSRNKFI